MMQSRELLSAVALWTASLACMAFGSLDYGVDSRTTLLWWGCWLAIVACIPTAALIMDHFTSKTRDYLQDVDEVVTATREHHDDGDRPTRITGHRHR